jgi:hypothetical protein
VQKTQIDSKPKNQVVDAPMVAKFDCMASTDASHSSQLNYTWLKNGEPIDYKTNPRYYKDINTHALHILESVGSDSADYTCHVASDIDSDSATAKLTVRGSSRLCLVLNCFICCCNEKLV